MTRLFIFEAIFLKTDEKKNSVDLLYRNNQLQSGPFENAA